MQKTVIISYYYYYICLIKDKTIINFISIKSIDTLIIDMSIINKYYATMYIYYLVFNSIFFHYLKVFKQITDILKIIYAYAMTIITK